MTCRSMAKTSHCKAVNNARSTATQLLFGVHFETDVAGAREFRRQAFRRSTRATDLCQRRGDPDWHCGHGAS
jgi:hypothetical protein